MRSKWIAKPESDEIIEQARGDAAREERDKWIRALANSDEIDMTHREIGELSAVGLSRERVGQIVRGD